jgi:L-threonylcarbamoyladenylate synthase
MMRLHSVRRSIDPVNPDPQLITEAALIIKGGGIVSFPTRSLYGLGVDAGNRTAVARLIEVKKRPRNKPILVLIRDAQDLKDLVETIPEKAVGLMDQFWPGNITLVCKARSGLPGELTAGTGKIGIRQPGNRVAAAIVDAARRPITGTSANISGETGCSNLDEFDPLISREMDLILDAGPLKGGPGSSVVDVTGALPKILREGSIPAEKIFSAWA